MSIPLQGAVGLRFLGRRPRTDYALKGRTPHISRPQAPYPNPPTRVCPRGRATVCSQGAVWLATPEDEAGAVRGAEIRGRLRSHWAVRKGLAPPEPGPRLWPGDQLCPRWWLAGSGKVSSAPPPWSGAWASPAPSPALRAPRPKPSQRPSPDFLLCDQNKALFARVPKSQAFWNVEPNVV